MWMTGTFKEKREGLESRYMFTLCRPQGVSLNGDA